jgi:hypothetical protein
MEQPNLNYLRKLTRGNQLLEERFLNIIKNEFPEDVASFYKKLNEKNYISASKKVHKLKHKIAFLGLEKGYEVTAIFENNLKNKSIELLSEFEAIIASINQFIKTLTV